MQKLLLIHISHFKIYPKAGKIFWSIITTKMMLRVNTMTSLINQGLCFKEDVQMSYLHNIFKRVSKTWDLLACPAIKIYTKSIQP